MPLSAQLPRYPLALLPTPLHPLPRLSAQLRSDLQLPTPSLQLWIKRDDQTGLACGGNKTRKLEFLIGDALAQGCDTLITTGAMQSNHCRQTAAAAAKAGLACELVLSGQPPAQPSGNLLLDMLFGAGLHWTTRENRLNRLRELADELRAAGHKPYFITYGGSDPVGATGYALAMDELDCQAAALGLRLDLIVVPSSSGGTQAGIVAGAHTLGWDVPILGISIDEPEMRLRETIAALASQTAARMGQPRTFSPADIRVSADYLGGGYGVVGDLERAAITLMAHTEGILLDPVYTGRAFGGLLDLLRNKPESLPKAAAGEVQTILFWHTGGQPALFAYAADLL